MQWCQETGDWMLLSMFLSTFFSPCNLGVPISKRIQRAPACAASEAIRPMASFLCNGALSLLPSHPIQKHFAHHRLPSLLSIYRKEEKLDVASSQLCMPFFSTDQSCVQLCKIEIQKRSCSGRLHLQRSVPWGLTWGHTKLTKQTHGVCTWLLVSTV